MKRDIAIIGMSGRFPKSDSLAEFWTNLVAEKEFIHFYSDEELAAKGVDKKKLAQKNYIKAASFVEGTNYFDYPFFRYTLDEARIMNPQTRMMHQLVWEALESSGCNIEAYRKKIGIFLGANKDLNWSLYATMTKDLNVDQLSKEKLSNPNFMASLIAYKLNFKGPCYFIDTACSTSLSTAHLACRSLLLNECGIAVVGGARLLSVEDNGYEYVEGSIMSDDGHNQSFDSRSKGTIGSDGAGVVILKRLEEAIKDNDQVIAVIKGSAMNNDGKAKAGYTMPSVEGQSECIKLAQKIAGVSPREITYIEAHGTGTKIGDPIEIESLNLAFNNDTEHKCAIGTIKSNMGHADEAAGIAGLIKTALAIQHKTIPASLHFQQANPTINFKEGPFYVNHSTQAWKKENDQPLTAGVSSLGIGGTNVHMILQETPALAVRPSQTSAYNLVRYSAKTETALEQYEEKLLTFLESNPVNITDLAYTLQVGRKQFDFIKHCVVKDQDELIAKLRSGKHKTQVLDTKSNSIFMFSGQGSQYVNMGKGLYDTYPAFQEIVEEGLAYLQEHTGRDYRAVWFSESESAVQKINETLYTQPLLFLFEYALAQLLMQLGLRPSYLIGHSLGEYVAATIGGVFSFKDALKIVAKRGDLMYHLEEGDMLSIAQPLDQINRELLAGVSIAAINTADSFVVSGSKTQIALVKEGLQNTSIAFTELKTSHAFHSEMMEAMLDDFKQALSTVSFNPPQIPFISNVSGTFISPAEAMSVDYWADHIRQPVKFLAGIRELITINHHLFIEVGPGRTLASFYKKAQDATKSNGVLTTVRHPREVIDDQEYFLDFVGKLWGYGMDVDWTVFYQNNLPNKISLPTYAFDQYDLPAKVSIDEKYLKKEGIKGAKKEIAEAMYMPSWKYAPLNGTKESPFADAKKYLVFTEETNFCEALLQELKASGKEVLEVQKGAAFMVEKEERIVLNPKNSKDFESLYLHFEVTDFAYDAILYAWDLVPTSAPNPTDHFSNYNTTFSTVLQLAQALQLTEVSRPQKISVLSNANLKLTGLERTSGLHQHTGTLLQVLTQESASLHAAFIDVDVATYTEKDLRGIVRECASAEKYAAVAFRSGRRWLSYLEPLESALEADFRAEVIRPGGVYLITGTMGDMEYALSSHLLQDYQASVILLTNDAIYKWDEKAKQRYEKLKKLPGKVRCMQVDIANYEKLSAKIAEVEKEFGSLHGILHMARNTSVADIALVANISEDIVAKHFSTRVNGLLNISRIVGEKEVDFVKVISTLSTYVGGVTYGAYAAAAMLMDCMVVQKEDAKWSVVNLDRVQEEDPWISLADLVQVFHLSFAYDQLPQLVVSKRNLDAPEQSPQKESKIGVKANRKLLKATYTQPKSETEKRVVSLFENLFGIAELGVDDDFFELGGDSLKAILLINKLKKDTGIELSMTDIFTGKSIANISELVAQKKWMQEDSDKNEEIESIVI